MKSIHHSGPNPRAAPTFRPEVPAAASSNTVDPSLAYPAAHRDSFAQVAKSGVRSRRDRTHAARNRR